MDQWAGTGPGDWWGVYIQGQFEVPGEPVGLLETIRQTLSLGEMPRIAASRYVHTYTCGLIPEAYNKTF